MDVMTPFFQAKCMEKLKKPDPMALSKQLNIEEIFYDIDRRNQIVMKPKNAYDD